jgi:hypothetical protein
MASLSINDDAAVARTFSPISVSKGVAAWGDRSAATLSGMPVATYELREPTQPNKPRKIVITIRNPTEATDGGGSTYVSSFSSARLEINLAPDAVVTERKDLYAFLRNFLAKADVDTALDNVEPFWG